MSSSTTRKKAFSLFMTLVMILGLLPTAALATGDSNTQIQSSGNTPVYYTWDKATSSFPAASTGTNPLTSNNPTNGAPLVTTSKTIAGTGIENQFKITLNVDTTQRIETTATSPTAGVVLVFDLSYSMSGTPLTTAKNASKNFLANFLGFSSSNLTNPGTTYTDALASRWVSIVTFSDNSTVSYQWKDLRGATRSDTQNNLNDVFSAIDGFTVGVYTNTDSGLQKAESQWSKFIGTGSGNLGQSAVTNRFTVLLTDGTPNRSGTTPAGSGYNYPFGYSSTGRNADHNNPALRAGKLMAAVPNGYATKLYSIYFDTSAASSGGSSPASLPWLTSISNQTVLASNAAELNTAFSTIIEFIRLEVDAWKVNDPMGPYMNAPVPILAGHDSQAVTVTGNTLIWNLRADLANASFKNYPSGSPATYDQYRNYPNNAYTISYTLSYTVTLNNLDANVLPNAYYKTNGRTTLNYFLTKNGRNIDDSGAIMTMAEPLTLDFKVPAVKSLFTDISFTKVARHSSLGLPGASFTLTAAGGAWSRSASSTANGTVTFQNVPSGHSYTLSETTAPATYDALTGTAALNVTWGAGAWTAGGIVADGKVENRLNPQNLTYTVKKLWQGGQNHPSVTIHIMRSGTNNAVYSQTLSGSENPAWQFTKLLPTVDPDTGSAISYYVTEDATAGYIAAISTFDGNRVATVTNTISANQSLTITKNWVAPESTRTAVNAILYFQAAGQARTQYGAPIALNSGNGWSTTLTVPVYDGSGSTYTYTVEEQGTDNGSITLGGNAFTVSVSGTAITNTIRQEETSISFTKSWKVAALDESEKASLTATFTLYADGTATGLTTSLNTNQTGASFQSLPKYALGGTVGTYTLPNDGHEISYRVEETSISDSRVVGTTSDSSFTNTLTDTTSVDVRKEWAIPENFFEDGVPEVTIVLVKNGTATDSTLLLNDDNSWAGSFSGLAKYDENGALIRYTVAEQGANQAGTAITLDGQLLSVSITGSAESGYTVTNSAIGSTSFTAYKDWIDGGNAGETRPEAIHISLYADGQRVDTATLTLADAIEGNSNRWAHTFDNLPAYGGTSAIVYTIAETDAQGNILSTLPAARDGDSYIVRVSGNTVTNSLTQRNDVTVGVTKAWVDGGNAQGVRPASVTIRLTGSPALPFEEKTLTLNADNGWADSFRNLPRYLPATGEEIHYGVAEISVSGYSSAITGSAAAGFTVTNTLGIPTINLPIHKVWVDGGADHSTDSVVISLLRGGTPTGQSIALSRENNWSSVFSDLPVYSADYQTAYSYSVDELTVPAGYAKQVSGGVITNTILDPKTELTLVKRWIGPAADRPSEITLGLFRTSGSQTEPAFVENVTLTAQENWTATLRDLPTRDGGGHLYTYSVKELVGSAYRTDGTAVFGGNTYHISAEGLVVTNTVEQGSVTVEGDKLWSLGERELPLPDKVTIQLYRDGAPLDRTVLLDGGEGGWHFFFGELEKYALGETGDGHEYVYSVKEVGADANGDIAFGIHHFKVSGGGKISAPDTERDGFYDLTNTYVSTDRYYYKVTAHYTTHNTSTGADSTVTATVLAQTEGSLGQTVTRDGSEYTVYGGNTYTFNGTAEGNVLSATLEESNHVYELVLYYTRSFTPYTPPDDTPYTPPYNPPPRNPPTPSEPPVVEIPEEESPLSPNAPIEEVPPASPAEESIDMATLAEEVVPLGNLPQTGTTQADRQAADPTLTMGALALSLSLTAAGLAILIGRKKEEPSEN